jgi:hypothetical protein
MCPKGLYSLISWRNQPTYNKSKQLVGTRMIPQLMIQPSSFLHTGLHLQPVGNFSLFRFTDELQTRLETQRC